MGTLSNYHSVLFQQAPMGVQNSNTKNAGGQLHGGGAWMVQLSPYKCPPSQQSYPHRHFVLSFQDRRGQLNGRDSCILCLKNRLTYDLIARRDVWVHQNDCSYVCSIAEWQYIQSVKQIYNHCLHGRRLHGGPLQNHTTVKIGGLALAWKRALAQDNMVT